MSKSFYLKYKQKEYEVTCDEADFNSWGDLVPYLYEQRKKMRVALTKGRKKGSRVKIYLHRFILKLNNPKDIVDHIDGNPLNNCRNNLRICNGSINKQNSPKQVNNKSGYKGVSLNNTNKKYVAQIGHNNTMIRLGSYNTPEEAARAYDSAAKKLFGELAKVNFK